MIGFARSMDLHDRVTAVYEDARDDVYYYVLTLGLPPAQAQEVTQEVFLRLYVQLKNGESIDNIRGWIFRVAHNFGLNTRARERAHDPLGPELQPEGREPDPEQQFLETDRDRRIKEALSELSPQQRQVLHLRAEGLRYREIAEALGIGTSTVNEFLRRAIVRLRKVLHE
jgi:RNA polymerase sigma-70 factor (ECF subfamily)